MNWRLQGLVKGMREGAEAWCAGNRKFWAAAVGQKRSFTTDLRGANRVMSQANLHAHMIEQFGGV